MALKKKGIQRYQKIGGFVNLRQLHHSGMPDDRWKPLAIGKTGECDLKSKDWRHAIPLRCIPCSSPRWSDWWFLDTSRTKAKSRKSFGPREKSGPLVRSWVCAETSTALLRCIATHCISSAKNSGQELQLMPFNIIVKAQKVLHMTKNRLMVAFDSNKGPNLKVVKWCWKG